MKKILICVLLLFTSIVSKAQHIGIILSDEEYDSRIKLVDEFFERFNGQEDRPDISRDDSAYAQKRLLALFNGKMFKSFKDSAFVNAKEFVDVINKGNVKIDFSDSLWIAHVTCNGTFKKKEVVFDLYLTVQYRAKNMYKWVIAKASGKLFTLLPLQQSERIMLMPDDHETRFMSLNRITHEKDKNITNYIRHGVEIDQTSVFLSYVYNGLLDINFVDDLEFIFLQVPGYEFRIKDFSRKGMNSGWLIHDFRKITNEEKSKFLNYIYN